MSSENTVVIEISIEIDATPARVWELVSEVRNAPQWSSQAAKVFATGGRTAAGTRALNINKQGPAVWPTISKVVEFEPGRRIGNRIGGHRTVWSFELEPTPSGGTKLTERQDIPAALVSIVGTVEKKIARRRPGKSGSGRGSGSGSGSGRRGPSSALQRIKTLAEQA